MRNSYDDPDFLLLRQIVLCGCLLDYSEIIFNETKIYKFSTRLHIQNELLDIVSETRLLGTIISSDLSWWKNTNDLTRKGYQRLEIIRKLYEFNVPIKDLVLIYTMYVRSILEFNCRVWHFSLTIAQSEDLERVQKIACKIILKDQYISYDTARYSLNIETLEERRLMLCKRFATNCLKYEKTKNMFPLNTDPKSRHSEKYQVKFARNSRLLYSAIPQMQRLLNDK